MSDDKNTGGEGQEFTPPATQEEFNRIISERIDRERKKFADYDDLKVKAEKFDGLSDSKKSDEQETDARITELEKQLAASQQEAQMSRIQARYSISDDDAELFLTATDAEKLESQAKALSARISDRKKNGPVVSAQKGNEDSGGSDPMREFAQRIFNRD